MVAVIPGVSHNDAKGVLDVLGVLATDAKYKERLQALLDQTYQANQALEALQSSEKAASMSIAAAEAMHASITQEAQDIHTKAMAEKAEWEAKHADLAKREAELAQDVAEHEDYRVKVQAAIGKQHSDHHAAIDAREKALDAKAAAIEADFSDKNALFNARVGAAHAREVDLNTRIENSKAEAERVVALKGKYESALAKIHAATTEL
jgi:hypothetical protein